MNKYKSEGIEVDTPIQTKIDRSVDNRMRSETGTAVLKHIINTILTASLTFGLTMTCFVKQIWVNTESIKTLNEKEAKLALADDITRDEITKRVLALAQNISENTAVSKESLAVSRELAITTKQSVYMLSVALGFEGKKLQNLP